MAKQQIRDSPGGGVTTGFDALLPALPDRMKIRDEEPSIGNRLERCVGESSDDGERVTFAYRVRAAKYASVSVNRPADTGTVTFRVRPS